MRFIRLTQGNYALVDNADYDRLAAFKWYFHKGRAVRKPRTTDRKQKGFVWMHREVAKPDNDKVVDHINGYTLDNTRENLRVCTRSQNQWNKNLHTKSFSGIKNIYWKKEEKRYVVRFQKYGKKVDFGSFKDLQEAIKVRNQVVNVVHEGFNSTF